MSERNDMSTTSFSMPNGHAVALSQLDGMSMRQFREAILDGVGQGLRLAAFFAYPQSSDTFRLWAVLADDRRSLLTPCYTDCPTRGYPALTPECPQAHLFEREIFEQWGLIPEAHPWLKPVRFQACAQAGRMPPVIGEMDDFQVEGDEIHEVAVGPVHAGIIEPGHFRFHCHGETVLHLEISLGYQHRGVERAMNAGPTGRSIHYMETLAGDTTIGHTEAYCHNLEALCGISAPLAALSIRGIALELERLANHIGDLGALSGDVGFLPTAAYCGRIRGDALNMTALLCGNRFGRGLIRPGGVGYGLSTAIQSELQHRLDALESDVHSAVNLLWNTSSVMARFETTGALSAETAQSIGLVGPAARACGLERDVRQDFPLGIYPYYQVPVATGDSGDVFSRAWVRWLEVQGSIAFIRELLNDFTPDSLRNEMPPLKPDHLAVSLIEGWRGEICHVAITDDRGRFKSYKVVDPSFHNWFALALALRNQEISDFPLCNKSFNLSYCGHDL
jgi:Ni,Fe-hydrogenase III large subunit